MDAVDGDVVESLLIVGSGTEASRMSSRAGSTFVTFLMSIPVVAAGMVAFFGVPPLSTVIAATRGLNSKLQNLNSDEGEGSRSSSSQFEEWDSQSAPSWDSEGTEEAPAHGKHKDKSREVDDLGFSKFSDDESDDNPTEGDSGDHKHGPSGRRIDSTKNAEFAWRDSSKLSSGTKLLGGSPSSREEMDSKFHRINEDKTEAPVSMKDALKKLNSLGVKNYHLERGVEQDTWLFVCLFSPGDDSRVVHRFEAESNDPEGAVAETLKQIDGWLLKRFRDKQPISQTAM